MSLKALTFTSYYAVLGAIVVMSALYTVAQSSRVVLYGETVAELHVQKQELEHQKGLLQQQLASNVSLIQVQQTAQVENFTSINSTIKVNAGSTVATRQ